MDQLLSDQNPLREGLRLEKNPEPCSMVIFGATGDLTHRKLMPALFHLFCQDRLPSEFAVLGSGRDKIKDSEFREKMKTATQEFTNQEFDATLWETFREALFYEASDAANPDSYQQIESKLKQIEEGRETGENRLFYLAVPPGVYTGIIEGLNRFGLSNSNGWARIIVEKPFGTDLETARQLNQTILEVFEEECVYRIDHYLGKETVQNIMVLRFANAIFEPLWNRQYIDHVQITASEDLGIGDRGGYYDGAGALRDMVQNHLFQVFSLIAMEPPASMGSEEVRDEKTRVMRAVRPISRDTVEQRAVRGQYSSGMVDGEEVPGYLDEEGVADDSTTETFAALKLFVDNWRWADIPFFIRTGKRLPKRVTEVAVQFKRAPHQIFPEAGSFLVNANKLVIRIQPDEGISLKFRAKIPGKSFELRPVSMDFRYGSSFGKALPEAYERLLLDAMMGDPTLFARGDMVETAWALLDPILEAWKTGEVPQYEAGSWGPCEADALLDEGGRKWRRP